MKVSVRKWGNSLAVRIPRAIAAGSGLTQGTDVNISLRRGKVVLEPVPKRSYALGDLVSGITKANRHGETVTGGPMGRETW